MDNQNYWFLIIVIGIIVIGLVILILCLSRNSPSREDCKMADYPSIAINESKHPNVVEVSLTASDNEVQILNGERTKLYNYNKSFPGPMIEAKKGDKLIVHFFNDISEPSTITWHGLLTPANMDGSSISQYPVEPGESFTYTFDLNTAGLFYYHSDINPREQVFKGLYGVVLVHDHSKNSLYSLPATEKVLAFSDLKLNSTNQVDLNEQDNFFEEINGIAGNVLLTNGVSNGCISLTRDEPTRLRMVNCAVDRFMKIYIEGHDILKIGGDQGLLERPILIKDGTGLMLTPGERADIVFVPRSENIRVLTERNPRGIQKVERDECGNYELVDSVFKDAEKLLLVTFITTNEQTEETLKIPLEMKRIKKIHVDHCTPVIPVSFGINDSDQLFAFKVDKEGVPFSYLTPKEAPIVVEDGTYIIEVTNYSPLANNFHLHGFTFQHLDTLFLSEYNKERVLNNITENKDTIYIPGKPEGRKAKTVVRLAVRFESKGRNISAYGKDPTEKRSGGWIFQSHVLSSAEAGQEGFIQIVGECERDQSSSTNYSYSSYEKGDHSTCLTSSKYSSRSSSLSRSFTDSMRETRDSISELTKSLITCSCGSGLSSTDCCSSSFKTSLESRLKKRCKCGKKFCSCESSSISYKPYSLDSSSYDQSY